MVKERPNLKLVEQTNSKKKSVTPSGGSSADASEAPRASAQAQALSSGESPSRPEDVFDIVSLKELSTQNRHHIEQIVSDIAPSSTLIGVGHTPEAWDLRPTLMVKGEKQPSIIRFLGPELSASKTLTKKLEGIFSSLKNQEELSLLKDFGSLDGQLWYRREFVEYTLEDFFRAENKLDFDSALRWCSQLLEKQNKIHELGLFHGHISPSNIGIVMKGASKVSQGSLCLLDTSVRISLVQAERRQAAKNGAVSKGFKKLVYSRYLLNNLAPEILEAQSSSSGGFALEDFDLEEKSLNFSKSDIFALGKIYQDLLSKVNLNSLSQFQKERFQQKLAFIFKMVDEDSDRRPKLEEVEKVLGDYFKGIQEAEIIPNNLEDEDSDDSETESFSAESSSTESSSTKSSAPDFLAGEPLTNEPESIEPEEQVFDHSDDNLYENTLPATTFANDYFESSKYFEKFNKYKKSSSNFTWLMAGLFLLAFSIFLFFNNSASQEYSGDELSLLWSSGVPSKMQAVAEVALSDDEDSELAESIILSNLNDPSFEGVGLNKDILKIAFDSRWERELTFEDKKFAIALYLAKILEPKFLAEVNSKFEGNPHPALILALAASGDERAAGFLSGIDISYLLTLPRPISDAFRTLKETEVLGEKTGLNASDPDVRTLAMLASLGVQPGFKNSERLHSFTKENTQIKLKSLVSLFSNDSEGSEYILTSLLKHPNLIPNSEFLLWGIKQKLTSDVWSKDFSSGEILALLSGIVPEGAKFSKKQLESLFLHPEGTVRAAAMALALERFEWSHPGTVEVFKSLMQNPEQLSALQTARLAPMLSNPAEVPKNIVADWLKENPNTKLVSKLLLSTSAEKEPTELDFVIAQYLETKGWRPSYEELLKLSSHPERTVRLRVYEKAFLLEDKAKGIELLEKAKKTENDLGFLDSIEEKISYLKK